MMWCYNIEHPAHIKLHIYIKFGPQLKSGLPKAEQAEVWTLVFVCHWALPKPQEELWSSIWINPWIQTNNKVIICTPEIDDPN